MEVDGQILAAFADIQNNVRKLIDIESNSLVCNYEFSAFGKKTENSQQNVLILGNLHQRDSIQNCH